MVAAGAAAFMGEEPHTSAGKHDKKLLRTRHAEGSLDVVVSDEPPAEASAT